MMLFINFKTYQSGTGEQAEKMAEILRQAERVTGVPMIPVLQATDVFRVSKHVWDWAWCQHVDGIEYGAHTGWQLPEGIKQNGAAGIMLNHSERKFRSGTATAVDAELLQKAVERCRAVGLKVGICADSVEELEIVLKLHPDWVAYEPPELIGAAERGEKISVASAEPEVVKRAVAVCDGVPLLIGAGIQSVEDIRVGLSLGAAGFLIASAVMKATDPDVVLRELAGGYGK